MLPFFSAVAFVRFRKAVGVSNYGPDALKQAHTALKARGVQLASQQIQFSLTNRCSIHLEGVNMFGFVQTLPAALFADSGARGSSNSSKLWLQLRLILETSEGFVISFYACF